MKAPALTRPGTPARLRADPGPKPKVVVTLPAYCAERTLAKTVAAIPAGAADEVILVDDASPDQTVADRPRLGIQVVVHPRTGATAATRRPVTPRRCARAPTSW